MAGGVVAAEIHAAGGGACDTRPPPEASAVSPAGRDRPAVAESRLTAFAARAALPERPVAHHNPCGRRVARRRDD